MKVYAFANTKDIAESNRQEWVHGVAIREDGVVLAQHVHSSLAWCRTDLSLDGLCGEDILRGCPGGCEVEFIEPPDVDAHEGLRRAFALNDELCKQDKENRQ